MQAKKKYFINILPKKLPFHSGDGILNTNYTTVCVRNTRSNRPDSIVCINSFPGHCKEILLNPFIVTQRRGLQRVSNRAGWEKKRTASSCVVPVKCQYRQKLVLSSYISYGVSSFIKVRIDVRGMFGFNTLYEG